MRWCESVLQNEDNDNTTHDLIKMGKKAKKKDQQI